MNNRILIDLLTGEVIPQSVIDIPALYASIQSASNDSKYPTFSGIIWHKEGQHESK